MESSSRNNLVAGQCLRELPGEQYHFSGGIAQGGGSNSVSHRRIKTIFFAVTRQRRPLVKREMSCMPHGVSQYNYQNGNSCPAGSNLTSSNISLGFTSADNQSIPSGGNGTWSLYVVSNLSIRHVQFLLDGSTTPIATQEIQDVNSNFGNDQKWLYHVTTNTSALASGTHTITALAEDAGGRNRKGDPELCSGWRCRPPSRRCHRSNQPFFRRY